jgi:hypothetical protein
MDAPTTRTPFEPKRGDHRRAGTEGFSERPAQGPTIPREWP